MVKRIGTGRRKTRHKLKQHYRNKGKVPLSKYFQAFKAGDRVALVATANVSKGMYFPRLHGKVGKVTGQRGFCYRVAVMDGRKEKLFNVHPVHLKLIK
jgi:large subunit ribosomal protein L21e